MYEYRATCRAVVDGDTLDARIDLGFHAALDMRLRLAGLDTDELRSPDPAKRAMAQRAKERVAILLPPGAPFTVRTLKDATEKYGRYLAVVILPDGTDMNALLVREGLARSYDGGTRG